jgi:hypothetical protein
MNDRTADRPPKMQVVDEINGIAGCAADCEGEFGADIIQRVRNDAGRICETVLWEAKSTKVWSDRWLEK